MYVSILLSKTTSLDTLQPHSFKIIFISYTLKIIDGKKKNSSKKRIQKMKPLKIERMAGSKRLKQLPTLVFFSL